MITAYTQEQLAYELVRRYGTTPANSAIVAERMLAVSDELRDDLQAYWDHGTISRREVRNWTVERVMYAKYIGPLEAILFLDWLVREPELAAASLAQGRDLPPRKTLLDIADLEPLPKELYLARTAELCDEFAALLDRVAREPAAPADLASYAQSVREYGEIVCKAENSDDKLKREVLRSVIGLTRVFEGVELELERVKLWRDRGNVLFSRLICTAGDGMEALATR